jgi:HD-GYP domain-containing protein (c-di-GMP phosphodiesterase class II)
VLGARDAALVRHARSVADLAEATARALSLSHTERETIRLAAELHEAGRLMLQGTSGVSAREVAAAGARVVAAAPAIAHAAPLIDALHEPWQVAPLGARIVAVADAYDTVCAARGHDAALTEVRRSPRFDPDVLVAFAAICGPSAVPFIVA